MASVGSWVAETLSCDKSGGTYSLISALDIFFSKFFVAILFTFRVIKTNLQAESKQKKYFFIFLLTEDIRPGVCTRANTLLNWLRRLLDHIYFNTTATLEFNS